VIEQGFPPRLPPYESAHDPATLFSTRLTAYSWAGQPILHADAKRWPVALSPSLVKDLIEQSGATDFIYEIARPEPFNSPGQPIRPPRTCLIVVGSPLDPSDTLAAAAIASLRAQLQSRLEEKGVYCAVVGMFSPLGSTWLPASTGEDPSVLEFVSFTFLDSHGNPYTATKTRDRIAVQVDADRWTGGDLLYIHMDPLFLDTSGSTFVLDGTGPGGGVAGFGPGWKWLDSGAEIEYDVYDGGVTGVPIGLQHQESVNAEHVEEVRAALDATFNGGIFRRAELKVIPVLPTITAGFAQPTHESVRDLSLQALTDLVASVGGTLGTPVTGTGFDPSEPLTLATSQIVTWVTEFFLQ
jgi:hypothetical protein